MSSTTPSLERRTIRSIALFIALAVLAAVLALVLSAWQEQPRCPELQIPHGYGCCKDFNQNRICDADEVTVAGRPDFSEERVFVVREAGDGGSLSELQQKKGRNNLQVHDAVQRREDELREAIQQRENLIRFYNGEYVFGYDERLDR